MDNRKQRKREIFMYKRGTKRRQEWGRQLGKGERGEKEIVVF